MNAKIASKPYEFFIILNDKHMFFEEIWKSIKLRCPIKSAFWNWLQIQMVQDQETSESANTIGLRYIPARRMH